MALLDASRTDGETSVRRPRSRWTPIFSPARGVAVALTAVALGGLVWGYLRMSRTQPVNADGAANLLQAWDMLHGNPLLAGWTLSDVSFYTTELPGYALLELVFGLRTDVVHLAAAITYAVSTVAAAELARGGARGVRGAVRFGVPVVLMLAPQPWHGYEVLLLSSNHTGSGLPVLLAWLLVAREHRWRRSWPLPVLVSVLLAAGLVADPLIFFIGVLPLVIMGVFRLWRDGRRRPRQWRGRDAGLVLAGLMSLLLAGGFFAVLHLAGGFVVHPPVAEVVPVHRLGANLRLAADGLALVFGGYLPERQGWADVGVGVLHLAGLAAVGVAVVVAARRSVRRGAGESGDRAAELLALGVVINVVAFVLSTQPTDLLSARQVAAVLPLGAALAGRVCVDLRLSRRLSPVLAATMLVVAGSFVGQVAGVAVPAANHDIAVWLGQRDLRYGLGNYWTANNITAITGGEVRVAPVVGVDQVRAYRWESKADWYDPIRHDARFVVLDLRDLRDPGRTSLAAALRQFGEPLERQDFERFTVLVYAKNLLVGLPAQCGRGRSAPSMAQC